MSELPMLYPNAKRVLKALNQVISVPGILTSPDIVATRLNSSTAYVIEHAGYLDEIGLIKLDRSKQPMEYLMTPTELGKHYFDITWARFRAFTMKSLVVPFVVALLTSLATKLLFR